MQYQRFFDFIAKDHGKIFVAQTIDRIMEIEHSFGKPIEVLTSDDGSMSTSLTMLEAMIDRNALDNYQNAIHHYYKLMHGHAYPPLVHHRGFGNSRRKG